MSTRMAFKSSGQCLGTNRRPHGLSARRGVVDARCSVSSQGASRPSALESDGAIDPVGRRIMISFMLASSLLLPCRPSVAEEDLVAPEVLTEISTEIASGEASAPLGDLVEESLPPAEVASESALIEEVPPVEQTTATSSNTLSNTAVAAAPSKVYFDIAINGEPAGRITIELFPDAPAGASRFAALAAGQQGVDYRLSKFNGVLPTYIRNDGLNRLSYSATEVSPITDADSVEKLEMELDGQSRRHDEAGLVSLIVLEREARPVKERLVARDGKLITVLEQAGEAPNGTQFTITTAPSPELDSTNLIIGRVVEGSDLLRRISSLPVNRPRNDNPYFQAGKAIGDKRAVTAERAFYRPFQKVVVSSSGVIS